MSTRRRCGCLSPTTQPSCAGCSPTPSSGTASTSSARPTTAIRRLQPAVSSVRTSSRSISRCPGSTGSGSCAAWPSRSARRRGGRVRLLARPRRARRRRARRGCRRSREKPASGESVDSFMADLGAKVRLARVLTAQAARRQCPSVSGATGPGGAGANRTRAAQTPADRDDRLLDRRAAGAHRAHPEAASPLAVPAP